MTPGGRTYTRTTRMTSYRYSYSSFMGPRAYYNMYWNAGLHMTYHPLLLYFHMAYYYAPGYTSLLYGLTYYDGYGYNFYYGGYGYYEYSIPPDGICSGKYKVQLTMAGSFVACVCATVFESRPDLKWKACLGICQVLICGFFDFMAHGERLRS